MGLIALEHLLLGHHGVIEPGSPVPATYVDTLGNEQDTDVARLKELGVAADERSKAAQAVLAPAPDPEPEVEVPTEPVDDGEPLPDEPAPDAIPED